MQLNNIVSHVKLVNLGGNRVLVVQHRFSKYVNAYSMVDRKASTVAQLFCEQFVPEHGISESHRPVIL